MQRTSSKWVLQALQKCLQLSWKQGGLCGSQIARGLNLVLRSSTHWRGQRFEDKNKALTSSPPETSFHPNLAASISASVQPTSTERLWCASIPGGFREGPSVCPSYSRSLFQPLQLCPLGLLYLACPFSVSDCPVLSIHTHSVHSRALPGSVLRQHLREILTDSQRDWARPGL